MTRHPALWFILVVTVLAPAPIGRLAQKPTEALQPGLGAKTHGHPRDRLIPPDQLYARAELSGPANTAWHGGGTGGGGGTESRANVFVNDPCLDPAPTAPFPENFFRTVQSETDIAVLNAVENDDDDDDHDRNDHDRNDRDRDSFGRRDDDDDRHDRDGDDDDEESGQLMVAGYNDSFGFDDNRQGLSGFSYSTDGGRQWIDGGGLPPRVPSGVPSGTLGSDAYFGDPVVAVHHRTKRFYYASLYQNAAGGATLSVNRGRFRVAPRQVPIESFANTRCEANPALHGVPDPPAFVRKRIIWDPPVEAVVPVHGADGIPGNADDDFLDKEWLYVNQETGVLYLTYTRFTALGETPIELVRSFDGGLTWTPPSVIVPNLLDTFNQATQAIVTPTGRVIVTWLARTFDITIPSVPETEQRIEAAYSNNCSTPAPCTFSAPVIVDLVNPQRAPLGYNRATILNAPYIAVDKGRDDGKITNGERRARGFGNVYITYFDGATAVTLPPFTRAANILLARSTTNGASYSAAVKVNDDAGDTSHVFPSVHVNKHAELFVTWQDRRLDNPRNLLTDTWGDISTNRGTSFTTDGRITTVSTDWITREDAIPDYGDYNSGEVIDFQHFASIWADGRFPTPAPITATVPPFTRPADQAATPDSMFAIIRRSTH